MNREQFIEFMKETFGKRRFKNHMFNCAKYHLHIEDFGGWIDFLEDPEVEFCDITISFSGSYYQIMYKVEYLEYCGFTIKEEES
jgi:hypothetical protein